MPETSKVVGSNLTGPVFFLKREIFRFTKNCRIIICLLMVCRLGRHFIKLLLFKGFLRLMNAVKALT